MHIGQHGTNYIALSHECKIQKNSYSAPIRHQIYSRVKLIINKLNAKSSIHLNQNISFCDFTSQDQPVHQKLTDFRFCCSLLLRRRTNEIKALQAASHPAIKYVQCKFIQWALTLFKNAKNETLILKPRSG